MSSVAPSVVTQSEDSMRLLILGFSFLLLALPSLAERASITYYNYSGEYFTDKYFEIDIDVDTDSLDSVLTQLNKLRKSDEPHCAFCASYKLDNHIKSDLVIIGYGQKGVAGEFFAATADINNNMPLAQAIKNLPERYDGAMWRIYFVASDISHYVRDRKDLHWASPFRFLAAIGFNDLEYFQSI